MIDLTPLNVILVLGGLTAWMFGLAFAITGLAILAERLTPKGD